MSAAAIAKALHGRAAGLGRYLCRCPVPSHGKGRGDRRPSLIVSESDLGEGVAVHCLTGCDWREVKAELRRRGLLPETGGKSFSSSVQSEQLAPIEEPQPDPEALALWRAALEPERTLASRYLRNRGIGLAIPPTIRFLPDIVYPGTGHRFPAMVAAFQRPDRKIIAVQVTFLRPSDGAKAPVARPRLTVGRLGTGAVRLGPAEAVLGLAEGVETALSAMELAGVPCWASLGGQRLAKVTIPDTVSEIHLFGDRDDAGRLAAELAAERFTRDGRRVVLRYPPGEAKDWNDALQVQGRRAA